MATRSASQTLCWGLAAITNGPGQAVGDLAHDEDGAVEAWGLSIHTAALPSADLCTAECRKFLACTPVLNVNYEVSGKVGQL